MIVVRSLNTVGGERHGKRNTSKMNRRARQLGFATWAAMITAMMANQRLFANIVNIAAQVEQQQQ